ncbi:c-type cytochrome [Terasakiella sp. A23]|uniref:c-type cytochrome n=1 Tax=Terasakiella sp. FCG-A23 TaxID=3080561 RepID=UPI0029558E3F|nr:c-type cytochrome [Terasakiella sp. A23]MDV7341188.1 c-type cytochrome [Terasakiella sp. A23]
MASVQGDAKAGKKLFKRQCATCHDVAETTHELRGPHLAQILGRKAGALSNYNHYSPALKKLDLVWTPDLLEEYLIHPSRFLKKKHDDPQAESRMNVRVQGEKARKDIVAYLTKLNHQWSMK